MLETLLLAILMALVYGLTHYISKAIEAKEGFKPQKLLRTIVLSLVVGFFAAKSGVEPTLDNIGALFSDATVIGFSTAILDNVVKALGKKL